MSTWNSRGLRGSTLEDMINRTNERYLESGLALIQKIPTPITPINIDKNTRHITLAYFDQKSTVDYIGAVQGIPVCFDAKECAVDRFALQNYTHRDEFFYLPYEIFRFFWDRSLAGGRKSFLYEEMNPDYRLPRKHGVLVPYLDILQKDLEERELTNES